MIVSVLYSSVAVICRRLLLQEDISPSKTFKTANLAIDGKRVKHLCKTFKSDRNNFEEILFLQKPLL